MKGIYEINEFNGIFLQRVLNLLRKLDTTKVFYEPVDAIATPNYYDRIKQPMDFSKMQKKVTGMEYESVADLEADFNLMIQNCILFNKKGHYYNLAVKIRDQVKGSFKYVLCFLLIVFSVKLFYLKGTLILKQARNFIELREAEKINMI